MSKVHVVPASKETFEGMKGQKFVPHDGEGVVYIKLVMVKPETMEDGDPAEAVENAPGVLLCGQLNDIKAQIAEWFDQAAKEYQS